MGETREEECVCVCVFISYIAILWGLVNFFEQEEEKKCHIDVINRY